MNQTVKDVNNLRVRVRVYDSQGQVRYDEQASNLHVPAQGVTSAIIMPLIHDLTSTYFVRCELFDESGANLVDNIYWQSTTLDDVGDPSNDTDPFALKQVSWANFTDLNTMPEASLQISGTMHKLADNNDTVICDLHNPSNHIAFFERLEVTKEKGGDEILPIIYDDNYVTVFPGETVRISVTFKDALLNGNPAWLKVEGYNTIEEVTPVQ